MKEKVLIGRVDIIDLPEFGLKEIKAKIDTGAYTSSIHCSRIKLINENDQQLISFQLPASKIHGLTSRQFKTSNFKRKNVKSSSGHVEKRFVIKTSVKLFNRKILTEFSLTDRSTMKYPVLLGRKLLSRKFVVDVSQKNLSFKNNRKNS